MGGQEGGGGGLLPPPPPPFQFFSQLYIYYLNGAILVTIKKLNGTKDVLKYGPVGTCALISNLRVCVHMLQSGRGIGKWTWPQTY